MKLKRLRNKLSYIPGGVFVLFGIIAISLVELVFLHDSGKISIYTMLAFICAFLACAIQLITLCESIRRLDNRLRAQIKDNASMRASERDSHQTILAQELELNRIRQELRFYKRRCRSLRRD